MTRRTLASYCAFLRKIVERTSDLFGIILEPKIVTTDFELAAINAFKMTFPQSVINGCHFHLGQSVQRKVNELGLKTSYQTNPELALHVRMLYALAYVPIDAVSEALEVICAAIPDEGIPVLEYFDNTYVNGPKLQRGENDTRVTMHKEPMFPPKLWNVSDRFLNGLPTTSNHVEAWHRRFQCLLVIDHPSFYTCLHKIRQEQRRTEIQCLRLSSGFRRKRQRRSMTEHTRRLTTLVEDHRSGRKPILAFWRGVAHSFAHSDSQASNEHEVIDEMAAGVVRSAPGTTESGEEQSSCK